MSDDTRAMLRELVREALAGANGNGAAPPQVPAPPVAAVLRPSTWREPPRGGEVIGGGAAPAGPTTELVAIDSDADLDRFVRALADRLEDPHTRDAIRSGRLRFALSSGAGRSTGGGRSDGVVRVERGALTERAVQQAAKAGARLVLARGAVATPLAREKARALGIEIERE
jgi:hypothetical protein